MEVDVLDNYFHYQRKMNFIIREYKSSLMMKEHETKKIILDKLVMANYSVLRSK